jgi:hypothetical protein
MIDKAPPDESGDVVQCVSEETCVALDAAAKNVDETYAAIVEEAHEFARQVGKLPSPPPIEVKLPGYLVAGLIGTVREWRDAGQALHNATRAHAAAQGAAQRHCA